MTPQGGEILHFVRDKPGKSTGGCFAPSYFFPNSAANLSSVYWYLMRVSPTGPNTVTNQYEVYRHKDATDEQFYGMDKFFKQIEQEDKELCMAAQRNLDVGTYSSGPLHTFHEKGVLHLQGLLRKAVMDHHRKEEEAKQEIWPARASAVGNQDVEFCQKLEACTNGGASLAW